MQIISISKGSISKRTNGHYRAQFIITYEDGTKERQSITADKKHELQAKMVQFKKDIFAKHNEKDGSYKNSFVYYLLSDWMREKRVVEKLEKHEASGTIVISKSLAHVVGKGAVFQEPKTPKSKRSIKLISQDVEMLKTYREWQQQYADELSDVYVWHNDLMFTSPCGFPIQASNFLRRWFRPLLRACNIPDSFTFHQLRHYHASILMDLGVPPTEISSRLGHSSPRITLDFYTHELAHQPDKAIAKLEKYIEDNIAAP
ncbi:site-specific integrase [Anaerovibrio sp.]|uniref:site-specific integrase n=1 Tax=Anaerovibrio sp. TaxID=1872532 RepID=UPI00388DE0CD